MLVLGFSSLTPAQQITKQEWDSKQAQKNLLLMREAAKRRYAMQEKALEENLRQMHRWLERKMPIVEKMNKEQRAIVKRNYDAYKIAVEYYKLFKKLNQVRGTSEEVGLFNQLKELDKKYEKLMGSKIPLTVSKSD